MHRLYQQFPRSWSKHLHTLQTLTYFRLQIFSVNKPSDSPILDERLSGSLPYHESPDRVLHWSPDGQRIAFATHANPYELHLYKCQDTNSGQQWVKDRVIPYLTLCSAASWSDDSTQLIVGRQKLIWGNSGYAGSTYNITTGTFRPISFDRDLSDALDGKTWPSVLAFINTNTLLLGTVQGKHLKLSAHDMTTRERTPIAWITAKEKIDSYHIPHMPENYWLDLIDTQHK
jgi:hypothetical protein